MSGVDHAGVCMLITQYSSSVSFPVQSQGYLRTLLSLCQFANAHNFNSGLKYSATFTLNHVIPAYPEQEDWGLGCASLGWDVQPYITEQCNKDLNGLGRLILSWLQKSYGLVLMGVKCVCSPHCLHHSLMKATVGLDLLEKHQPNQNWGSALW